MDRRFRRKMFDLVMLSAGKLEIPPIEEVSLVM